MPVEMITSGAFTVIAPSCKLWISDKNTDQSNTHTIKFLCIIVTLIIKYCTIKIL
jgi:uncharacterized membrane protein YvlD (DUF360 family)